MTTGPLIIRSIINLMPCCYLADLDYETEATVALACLLRRSDDGGSWVLTVVNPDPHKRHEAALDDLGIDVIAGVQLTLDHRGARPGKGRRIAVNPGAVRVFAGAVQA